MRPPSYTTQSTRLALDVLRRSEEERRHGHADHPRRGRLLLDIDAAGALRGWSDAELHDALGLPQGSLRDGSLPTGTLSDAFLTLTEPRT